MSLGKCDVSFKITTHIEKRYIVKEKGAASLNLVRQPLLYLINLSVCGNSFADAVI